MVVKELRMEETSCPMCRNGNSLIVASGRDVEYGVSGQSFNFVKCEHCGLLYLNPRPAVSELSKIYPKNYHSFNLGSPLHSDARVDKIREKFDYEKYKKVFAFLERDDTVVDIGCGDARMLQVFKKYGPKGLNLVGIDINVNEEFRKLMKGQGISIIKSRFEDFNTSSLENVRVVVMSQLIEHVWNPHKFLEKLSKELMIGAYLIIETPDIDCVTRKLFSNWGGYHYPRHLQLFSKKTLGYYLEKNGFRIIKHDNIIAPSFWVISLRNFLGLNSFEKKKSFFESLNFKNPLFLGIFTMLDYALSLFGLPTGCQRVIAVKRRD